MFPSASSLIPNIGDIQMLQGPGGMMLMSGTIPGSSVSTAPKPKYPSDWLKLAEYKGWIALKGMGGDYLGLLRNFLGRKVPEKARALEVILKNEGYFGTMPENYWIGPLESFAILHATEEFAQIVERHGESIKKVTHLPYIMACGMGEAGFTIPQFERIHAVYGFKSDQKLFDAAYHAFATPEQLDAILRVAAPGAVIKTTSVHLNDAALRGDDKLVTWLIERGGDNARVTIDLVHLYFSTMSKGERGRKVNQMIENLCNTGRYKPEARAWREIDEVQRNEFERRFGYRSPSPDASPEPSVSSPVGSSSFQGVAHSLGRADNVAASAAPRLSTPAPASSPAASDGSASDAGRAVSVEDEDAELAGAHGDGCSCGQHVAARYGQPDCRQQ